MFLKPLASNYCHAHVFAKFYILSLCCRSRRSKVYFITIKKWLRYFIRRHNKWFLVVNKFDVVFLTQLFHFWVKCIYIIALPWKQTGHHYCKFSSQIKQQSMHIWRYGGNVSARSNATFTNMQNIFFIRLKIYSLKFVPKLLDLDAIKGLYPPLISKTCRVDVLQSAWPRKQGQIGASATFCIW